MEWNKGAASALLKDHTVITPDGQMRLVSCTHTYGDVVQVRFLDGEEPDFIYVGKEYQFPVLEEDWTGLLEEVQSLLPYVGLPSGEYANWLAQDAWKQIYRAESFLQSSPDAAHVILILIVQACNRYAMSKRTHFENYAQRLRYRARDCVEKASQVSESYHELYVNHYLET